MVNRKLTCSILIFALLLAVSASTSQAQAPSPDPTVAPGKAPGAVEVAIGSAFTYQGLLNRNGSPASSNCDFQFSLWDAATGGAQVGSTAAKSNVVVSKGVFTVDLDFGEAAFLTGQARWLQVAVRCPAGSGSYTGLAPRQALTTAPYALYSRGVWDFGATGSLRAGTPLGNGPGWTLNAANGHRRDIVGWNGGLYIGASSGNGAADLQFNVIENGNVGIGTYSPARRLHVVGDRIRLESGGRIVDLRADGAAVDLESETSSIFISSIGTGHHVVINPDAGDGNVGIGTAGPTDGKLQVRTESGDAIRIVRAGDDGIQIGTGAEFPNYGIWMPDPGTTYTAIVAETATASGEWGVYTDDRMRAANVTLNSMTLLAVAGGAVSLTPGDVVAAVGLAAPMADSTAPLPTVALAASGSTGIVGVVESRMALVPEVGKAGQENPPLVLHSAPGPATAGDYVALTIAGVARVKADAAAGVISVGQRLTSADTSGQVRALRTTSLDGMTVVEGAPVVGVALEKLETGQGLIWVLVDPR